MRSNRMFFIFFGAVLLKFIFARGLLFDNVGVFQTIFVEGGYLLLFFGLIELIPQRKLRITFQFVLNAVLSVILLAVLLYHNYFGYIVTFHALSLIGQVGTVKDSVFQLFEPVYLLLFIDFIILAIVFFIKKTFAAKEREMLLKVVLPVVGVGALLVGYQLFTQKDAEIASTVIAAEKQGILTYEILAMTDSETEADADFSIMKIQSLKDIVPLSEDDLRFHGIAEGKNLVVIQAEAFQNFAIGLEIAGQEVTPFLNRLVEKGLYFSNVYQQIAPGNTSDAEFIFNTSLYPSAWTPTSETFGDRDIPSLPKLLSSEGYTSMTFHANDVTFWNRDQMYPALGFDRYYDIEFFGNEDVIGIGPSDEFVYDKALPELEKLYENGEKFYAQFVSLSSHHPFKIPEDRRVLELPEEFAGTLVSDYLQSIAYTDWALEQFVNGLMERGMWEDTVFVVYGDHFGLAPSGLTEIDYALLEDLVGHEYTFLDQFHIPFIVSVGGAELGETFTSLGGQVDMLPTVANLLGLSLHDFVSFGQDIVNYPDNLNGMRYYMPIGSFFNGEIVFKPAEGFADGEAYDTRTGQPVDDFSMYEEDYERILELLKLSDQYLEGLPIR